MFPSRAFLFFAFVTLSAVKAGPLGRRLDITTSPRSRTIGFTRMVRGLGTGLSIPDKDRARALAMKGASHLGKRQGSIFPTNDDVTYTAQVQVGEGEYTLLVDTGSSNTWVGANQANPYQPGPQSYDTGNTVQLRYGSGYFAGEEWIDTVTLSSELVINQQSIGVANQSAGFNGFDGILAFGPVDLTTGTVTNTGTVPTIMDNLKAQGTISEEVLGVFFAPTSVGGTGELTLGGYDSSLTTSPVNYVPLTTTSPSSEYWGIDQTISYGSTTVLSMTAGIVDTGTTLILIASDAFQAYQSQTGATLDYVTGFLTITPDLYANLIPLSFEIGGTTYDLTPDAQTWPRSLNTAIGGNPSSIYLVVNDIGAPSGQGFDFINGYTFLERFYSVYDTPNSQVGLATTAYTDLVANQI